MDTLTAINLPLETRELSGPAARIAPALEKVSTIDPSATDWEARLSAATLGFVDVLLAGESRELEEASARLRDRLAHLRGGEKEADEIRGWLLCLLALTRWGLERLPATEESSIAPDGLSARFLETVASAPRLTSSDLRDVLGSGDSQISRVGRNLIANGLVFQRRVGRKALWELTPKGRALIERLRQREQTRGEAIARRQTVARQEKNTGRSARRARVAEEARSRQASTSHGLPMAAAVSGPSTERYVVEVEGGWKLSTSPDARAIRNFTNKRDAIKRGREIVGKTGVGWVNVIRADGTVEQRVSVSPEPRRRTH